MGDASEHPTHIGPYPVEGELGRGGMGVVYLGRDPRLNRQVAIKVLPAAFVSDPMRLQRFEREARTLAALNHRNIGMIFGLEDADGQRLLVLEFIPGHTLTEKLARPIPIDETVRLAAQIAEGLEVAHERDVVHRDLKPDNVRVTPEGMVKLLDFGLATQQGTNHEGSTAAGSQLTHAGMVMGTPGYMSPEQARGLPIDKRTDIWAFGCVLFEMLSGYKAFGGETVSDCIAAILDREPDYSLIPARTPNRLRELVVRCLVKDARRRLRDIGDARIELEDVLAQPQSGWYQAASGPSRPAATARLVMPLGSSAPGQPEVALANTARGAVAIAPDGTSVVFVAGRSPSTLLHVRRMDGAESRPIPGTMGADAPFFSPDGTKIAFFADGKLKRVALSGGAPVPLCAAPRPQGGCWDSTDTIYFIPDWQRGLAKIPAGGGEVEMVVDPDMANGELALIAPEILPGGRYALMAVWTGAGAGYDDVLISAIELRRGGTRRPLIHGGCNPKYLPSGHLVYTRAGALMAVAFDPERLEIFGQPMTVEDKVLGNALGGSSHFAAGDDGTLVVASGPVWEPKCQLLIAGRAGATAEPPALMKEERAFVAPAFGPVGRLLCVQVQGATDHLWLYDLDREGSPGTRLTFNADNSSPVFSPDGKRVAFRSTMAGKPEIYWMSVEGGGMGAGPPELLFSSDRGPTPCCFADGGKTIVFTQQGAARAGGVGAAAIGGGLEIWCAPVDGSSEARLLVQTPGSAWGACVSPDNKVIAFVSDESGRAEVYVQPYPGPGPRRVVSTEGGSAPLFAKHGGELYYRTSAGTVASVGGAGGMMPGPTGGAGQGAVGGVSGAGALPAGTEQIVAVRVTMEPFAVSRPRVLFQGNAVPASQAARNYDLLQWGGGEAALQMALQHFVILRSQESAAKVTSLGVTLNWFTELRRRIPVPQAPTLSSLRPGSSHFAVGGMSGSSAAPTRTQGGWGGGTYVTQGQHPPQPHPQQGATQAPNAPPPPQRNWSHDSKTIG